MKSSIKILSVLSVVLVAISFMFAPGASAQTTPYLSYNGSWNYDAETNALSITVSTIGMIAYADGSFGFSPYTDPIYAGYLSFSTLYNGDGAGENWSFAPDSGSSPDIILYDNALNGNNQRLTAELLSFDVVQNGSQFTVNASFDQDNVGQISVDANSPASKFIDDVNSFSPPWGNLYMSFNFSGGGATDFTVDQNGSFSGTFSVVPEPVSSLLFLTGGAAFALRRGIRKRRQRS